MKLLILTTLLILLPVQQTPTVEREESDLQVLKFSWSRYRQNSDLIHSAQDPGPAMNEPMSIKPPTSRNEPQEVKNRRDREERRADLLTAERNAAQSSTRKQDYYFLRLEVKNIGPNTIKSMVWEYQPSAETANYDLRQYICTMKAKPKESKTFELMSPVSPVKVVSADKQSQDGKVVINRIEYADGSVWKRKGWSVLIPADMTDQMGNGKCVMF
ncbi:MAG TPA: hypothetical protein VFH46_05310 [Pyrinomonadaceae bacterium]|nr:hypothetical protein [Pyrinomonadaceae bacterium]